MRSHKYIIATIASFTALSAAHADPAVAKPSPAKPAAKANTVTVFGSIRIRPEHYDYFGTTVGEGNYTFFGSLLRVGVTAKTKTTEATIELAQPTLLSLPEHAVGGAGQGPLGQGGNYYAVSGTRGASVFLKQASVKFKPSVASPNMLKLGRFEFFDGTEPIAADPSLAWIKQNRIAQRLIGNFGYTEVQRSFDAASFLVATPAANITGFAGMPTRGVFDLLGNDDISHVKIAYLAGTPKPGKTPVDGRLFGIYYQDDRPGTTKTDNRPAAVKAADTAAIKLYTYGGDYVRVLPTTAGKIDLIAWAAGQTGKWGALTQQSYAADAEIGYQPKKVAMNPWFRAGYFYASGDDNNADGTHKTFFPMLPTTRIYARFPFYTESNIKDAFAQVMLRPNPKTMIRSDYHLLSLANSKDLWYQGGGAFEPKGNFGYAGLTSNGKSNLGSLLDLSIDYKYDKATTWTVYTAAAFPNDVIKKLYNSKTATLTYVEYNHSF